MSLITLQPKSYEALSKQAEIALARRDPAFFAEYILTDEFAKPIKNAPIHERWHEHITNSKYSLIEAPREHGKTEQVAIARNIWKLGTNPNRKIKIVCANDSEAEKRGKVIAEHIESNSKIHDVFPKLKPDKNKGWTSGNLFVKREIISKDPSVEFRGILSSATGGRATDICFDDVCDLRNTIKEPALRKGVKDAFYNVWLNLLSPAGEAEYIFTPWHQDDLSHELKKNTEWSLLSIVIGEDLKPIWAERWDKDALLARKRQIGNSAFARGFQGRALADEDLLFTNISNCVAWDASIKQVKPEWAVYSGLDLAISQKSTADYTVLFTIAIDDNGRIWVLDIQRGRWRPRETVQLVLEAYSRFKPQIIKIENVAYQDSFLDWFDGYAGLPLETYTTGKQKMDEAIGLPSLAAVIDRGDLIIPMADREHPVDCSCSFCAFIDEMQTYPVGTHDDTVMAMFFAREASMNRNKVGFSVWQA